jgi:hypothetical protein
MEVSVAPDPPAVVRSRHTVFGRGLMVLAGWYATVIVALGLWVPTLPDAAPAEECYTFDCAFSPREGVILGLAAVGPIGGAVSIAVAVATLGLAVVNPMRSAVVAGTLAAAAGLIVPAVAMAAVALR